MRLKLRWARHLVWIPGLVVLAPPAFADPPVPPATLTRLGVPPGSIGFGGVVTGAGDTNADGVGDVLVGAPGSDRVYLVSGTGAISRVIPAPSTPGLQFGAALASVGDVNRDGVPDFSVGAPPEPPVAAACTSGLECGGPSPAEGRAFVFSGATGDMAWELVPSITAGTQFGRSVTGGGDLSGDGVPDIVVGAPSRTNAPGTVFAFSGANGAQLWSRQDPSPSFGELVVSTPDVSGDSIADMLVWSPAPSSVGLFTAGAVAVVDALVGTLNRVLTPVVPDRVHILSGATGAIVRIHTDPAPNAKDAFGASMVPAGDQDGDGIVDHLVGERGANQLHLYSGRNGVLIRSIAVPGAAQVQGTFALAPVDDKDGDGRGDVWVGVGSARTVYLINGQGAVLRSAIGPSALGAFGTAVGTVGNLGGDSGPDLVVGDPAEPGGGAAYLLSIGGGEAPIPPAQFSQAAGCSGAACEGVLRVRAQTTVPTTVVPTTVVPTTTAPTTTTSLTTTTTQATMGEAPATANLPKPPTATTAEGGHPGTGGVDRRVAGLASLGLGMAGITLLRRRHQPPLCRPPSAG